MPRSGDNARPLAKVTLVEVKAGKLASLAPSEQRQTASSPVNLADDYSTRLTSL
jgi:hypothetical protein